MTTQLIDANSVYSFGISYYNGNVVEIFSDISSSLKNVWLGASLLDNGFVQDFPARQVWNGDLFASMLSSRQTITPFIQVSDAAMRSHPNGTMVFALWRGMPEQGVCLAKLSYPVGSILRDKPADAVGDAVSGAQQGASAIGSGLVGAAETTGAILKYAPFIVLAFLALELTKK